MKRYLLFFAVMAVVVSSCIKDRVAGISGASSSIPSTTGDTLIHYWDFNNATSDPTFTVGGASFTYAGAYYDTVQPGSALNLQPGDSVIGAAIRLRNPAGALILTMPTTGYKNIVLKYAMARTSKGAQVNSVTYTTDGVNYISTAIAGQTPTYSVDTTFTLMGFDFSSDSSVNNNPNFKVQINFSTGDANTSGNDRLDNVSLQGIKE